VIVINRRALWHALSILRKDPLRMMGWENDIFLEGY